MPKCSYCNAEIDYLIKQYVRTWRVEYKSDINGIIEEPIYENIIWVCPICDGEIASNPDEVIDFFSQGGE